MFNILSLSLVLKQKSTQVFFFVVLSGFVIASPGMVQAKTRPIIRGSTKTPSFGLPSKVATTFVLSDKSLELASFQEPKRSASPEIKQIRSSPIKLAQTIVFSEPRESIPPSFEGIEELFQCLTHAKFHGCPEIKTFKPAKIGSVRGTRTKYIVADIGLKPYSSEMVASSELQQSPGSLEAIIPPVQPAEPSNLEKQPNREPLQSDVAPIDRTLSPIPPIPTLEQEKPEYSIPATQPDYQYKKITPELNFKKDLISPSFYNNIDFEQISRNAQIITNFQGVNFSDYWNSIIKPLRPTIETQPKLGDISEQIEQLIDNSMSSTSVRYPWILNGSDNLSFSSALFKPRKDEVYTNLDLRWSEKNPVVNQITFGVFARKYQFYWVLDNNRIVSEIVGGQGGLIYQGLERDVELKQTITLTEGFSGYQAAWVIPNDLQRLLKTEDADKYTVISVGGQLINPEGVTAGPVVINNSELIGNNNNVVFLPKPESNTSDLGTGSTYNRKGGGALFANLKVENAPLILQAFPTTDLRPLAGVDLKEKTVIPKDVLEAAGMSLGNIFTGEPAKFTATISSAPGIKVGQKDKFDNENLLNILVNPFLSPSERDYHYLNSLLWLPLGVQQPQIETAITSDVSYDWYRAYFSVTHNRVLLQYSTDKIEATYSNLFSSPGLSLSFRYEKGDIDLTQTLNSSIGLLMGTAFELLNISSLNESLDEAKDQRDQKKLFSRMNTKASSEERKRINQRLNSNLAYASLGSSLNQVSGYITFPSVITPTESSILQIKTGNLQRAVQFLQVEVGDVTEGDTFIAQARLSNRKFGPVTFLESTLPLQTSDGGKSNESSAAQVILVSPEGRKFVQQFNSNNLTTIPTTIKNYDLAFDRLVLQRIDNRKISNKYFNGYIYLPTVELVYAGTSDDFNYSLNTGIWFNVNNQAVGGITNNNFGIEEPTVGVYTNLILSSTTSQYGFDANNQLESITTQVPFLRFNWNSANNNNNPWQVSLSYTLSHQTRTFGASLTSSIGVIPQYSNGPVIGSFFGKVGLPMGLSSNFSLELGETIYYNLNILQTVLPNISIGPYVSNYTDLNQGFNSRTLVLNYGGLIQHQFPDSPVTFTAQLGTSENGLIINLKGGWRF